MSGYRSLHRTLVGHDGEHHVPPIWQVVTSPVLVKSLSSLSSISINSGPCWRIWTACGDGLVRGYLIQEKSIKDKADGDAILDASACTCICTHILLGSKQKQLLGKDESENSKSTTNATVFGCTQVRICRNYVGEDDAAGELLVVSLDLSGTVRVWSLPQDTDEEYFASPSTSLLSLPPTEVEAQREFLVQDATGTFVQICPVHLEGDGDVKLAIACLDGSIAIVATGLSTPNKATTSSKQEESIAPAGTVLNRWASSTAASSSGDTCIVLNGTFHPTKRHCFAIGRQDGLVEIQYTNNNPNRHTTIRLIQHEAPVRAMSFTPDGHLLITASDDGTICIWDISRSGIATTDGGGANQHSLSPALVNHSVRAHSSWILSVSTLQDSRRFVSCGADRKVNVWDVSQMDQPLHTFSTEEVVWCVDATISRTGHGTVSKNPSAVRGIDRLILPPRMVGGQENGGLLIYSLEG